MISELNNGRLEWESVSPAGSCGFSKGGLGGGSKGGAGLTPMVLCGDVHLLWLGESRLIIGEIGAGGGNGATCR